MKKNKHIFLAIVVVLSIVGTMTIGFGLLSQAEEMETKSEPVIIKSEDIGIKEIEYEEKITEETVYDETEYEDKIVDEDVSANEEIEEDVDSEEVTESPAPPEGKVEGYVAGVYFDPNENDCEICDQCYKCEDDGHIYAHCVSVEDRGYIYEEWCTICGHGTDTVISDEEFEALGVETNVEF